MFKSIIVCFFTLNGYIQTQNSTETVPKYFFGTWKIERFIEVGGHLIDGNKYLGEIITIKKDKFISSTNEFFESSNKLKPVKYSYAELEIDEYEKGSLGWYALDEAPDVQKLFTIFVGSDSFELEVTKNNELSFYFDGYFFILTKQAK